MTTAGNSALTRFLVKLLFILPGYLYHIFYLLTTPFASLVGLLSNLLIQIQLGLYVRAAIFGKLATQIASLAFTGMVDALYLTEFGVHFKSRIITIASILSFILSIFNPLLRAPVAIVQGIMVTWVSLREYRNDPEYCGNRLKSTAFALLAGVLYMFAAFLPFPVKNTFVNWTDLARGITSYNVIERIRNIDFNKPRILDISFLWGAPEPSACECPDKLTPPLTEPSEAPVSNTDPGITFG